MEPILVAAYAALLAERPHECSVDRILEDPAFRGLFLARVRASAADRTEFEILRGLNNLRKRSKLPRRDDLAD